MLLVCSSLISMSHLSFVGGLCFLLSANQELFLVISVNVLAIFSRRLVNCFIQKFRSLSETFIYLSIY